VTKGPCDCDLPLHLGWTTRRSILSRTAQHRNYSPDQVTSPLIPPYICSRDALRPASAGGFLHRISTAPRIVKSRWSDGASMSTLNSHPPNGALQTNKVLVRIGLIYPWSRLTNYLYENQYLMHITGSKKSTPLYLYIAYLSGFKKGGGVVSRGQEGL